ncbi:MAG: helix-turn-helix transcriptional regulator, partial [Actinomycetota bacterium]
NDLNVLFMCGLPPFGPGDLIEAFVDGDTVHIDMADYLARPMRLTKREALALLVMGRAIAELPGLKEAQSLRSALEKLEQAVAPGDASAAKEQAQHVAVDLERESSGTLAALRLAIGERRRLNISYFSFGRNEMTQRTICPLVVFAQMGRWYLEAFDDSSAEERVFRVDRIREIEPTGDLCTHDHGDRKPPETLFVPSDHDLVAIVEVSPNAAWVAEVTPYDKIETTKDGWSRLTLRTPHLAWIERLLMRLGRDARAIEPPELQKGVQELVAKTLVRYA